MLSRSSATARAGNAAATAIREQDQAGEVLIFSDEPQPAYYRPLIVNLIDEDINKDIFFLKERETRRQPGCNWVRKLWPWMPVRKRINLKDGRT